MGEIGDALNYPIAGDDRLGRIVIGGILVLFATVITPVWALITGYLVRIMRRVDAGDEEVPPAFEDWDQMVVEGVKGWLVYIIFSLPSIVLFFLVGFLYGLLSVVSLGTLAVPLLLIAIPLALVAVAVWVATMYPFPAAFAIFARTGELKSALSWSKIKPFLGNESYNRYFILGTAVYFGTHVATYALTATTLGALIAVFVFFCGLVSTIYLFSLGTRPIAMPVDAAE